MLVLIAPPQWVSKNYTTAVHRRWRGALKETMPQLDRLREQLAYLKFWLGIAVVTDISLIGWLISSFDDAGRLMLMLAATSVVLLSFGVVVLHRQIERRIDQVGAL